jgi:hypothetical protein
MLHFLAVGMMYYLVMAGLLVLAIVALVIVRMRGRTTDYPSPLVAPDGRTVRCPTCSGSGYVVIVDPPAAKPPGP